MSNYTEASLQNTSVPLPAAYTRQVSYDSSKRSDYSSSVYSEDKREYVQSPMSEFDSFKGSYKGEEYEGEDQSTAKRRQSVLILLLNSRLFFRVLIVLVMCTSLALVLTAVIKFTMAQKKPNHPLSSVPQNAPITDHPCIVFSGVAVMNLFLSVSIFIIACKSSKFSKSNNAITAVFTIISAIGFATSMGACFFLNKESTLQNDLWKWSCGNHKKGIVSEALDFNLVCHVVSYGWKLGLLQASLELFTFVVSVAAWFIIKYANFARYGYFGKF